MAAHPQRVPHDAVNRVTANGVDGVVHRVKGVTAMPRLILNCRVRIVAQPLENAPQLERSPNGICPSLAFNPTSEKRCDGFSKAPRRTIETHLSVGNHRLGVD